MHIYTGTSHNVSLDETKEILLQQSVGMRHSLLYRREQDGALSFVDTVKGPASARDVRDTKLHST